MLTEEQFLGWLSLPETQFVLRDYAKGVRQGLMEAWSIGAFTTESIEASAMKNAEKIAECTIWAELEELGYRDLLAVFAPETVQSYDEEQREKEQRRLEDER